MRISIRLSVAALVLTAGCAADQPTTPRAAPTHPRLDVFTQRTLFAYVADNSTNNVAVIRSADNVLVGTIPVGSGPMGVAAASDGRLVYVTNAGGGTVSVIRTADNTVVATIPVGSNPLIPALTPDGAFLYVPNYLSNTVSVIRTIDRAIVATIPVGVNPAGFAFTPDGSYAYVTNAGSDNVSVIRTSDYAVVATVTVGDFPRGIAITPNGASAYVVNGLSGNVSVINTTTNTVSSAIPVSGFLNEIVIAPDGSHAYVTNETGNGLSIIRISDAAVTFAPVAEDPTGIAMTPNGAFVYTTNRGNAKSVSALRTSDNTVVANVPLGATPIGIAIANLPPPTTQVVDLQSILSGLTLPSGTNTSLAKKLASVHDALEAGDAAAACSALRDFINEVAAQSGKKISAADATALINIARQISAQIGC